MKSFPIVSNERWPTLNCGWKHPCATNYQCILCCGDCVKNMRCVCRRWVDANCIRSSDFCRCDILLSCPIFLIKLCLTKGRTLNGLLFDCYTILSEWWMSGAHTRLFRSHFWYCTTILVYQMLYPKIYVGRRPMKPYLKHNKKHNFRCSIWMIL